MLRPIQTLGAPKGRQPLHTNRRVFTCQHFFQLFVFSFFAPAKTHASSLEVPYYHTPYEGVGQGVFEGFFDKKIVINLVDLSHLIGG